MRSYVRESIINEGFWVTSILVGCKMFGVKEFEVRESKSLFIGGWSLQFNKLILKSPRRNTCLFYLGNLSSRVLG